LLPTTNYLVQLIRNIRELAMILLKTRKTIACKCLCSLVIVPLLEAQC
nr:hypothetical protein [Tanacetum cinerariifolium]